MTEDGRASSVPLRLLPSRSAPLRDKPTLVGQRVTLRPVSGDDVEVMAEILGDPEVRRLTGSVHTSLEAASPEPVDARLREWYSTRSDQEDRSANLRVLLGPRGRDRGLGTEAVRMLTAYAIEVVGLHRIELEVFDFNPRARAVYEKVGYVWEGTRRAALRFDDEWIDAHVMAVLAPDWFSAGAPG